MKNTRSLKVRLLKTTGAVMAAAVFLSGQPLTADDSGILEITTARAPVAPNGTTAGAVTDFVITYRDTDPAVPGIGLKAGGTVTVQLAPEFRFADRSKPVTTTFGTDECKPPVLSCTTAGLIQGWPQSPILPFPSLEYDEATNTFTMTAVKDWMPAPPEAPGPKAIHMITLGFQNPLEPGEYPVEVTINPDPASSEQYKGQGSVNIVADTQAFIAPNSQANGKPPPPFMNTLHQRVKAGDSSLNMAFYLWDTDEKPLVGATLDMEDSNAGVIGNNTGKAVGAVSVSAPDGASEFRLSSNGPAEAAKAFVTGIATGRLVTVLKTDPTVTGEYKIEYSLHDGNSVVHTIETY